MEEEYSIFLPIDKEFLKVDGSYVFDLDTAMTLLDRYKLRMKVLYKNTEKENIDRRKLILCKIRSAHVIKRSLH